jgi:hypothetical protein
MYQLPIRLEKVMEKKIEDITIQDLLVLTQEELFSFLKRSLPREHTTRAGKTLVVNPPPPEGVTYRPMLCAHLDTVSMNPPNDWEFEKVGDTIKLLRWSNSKCLGGDDRAGVWIMLQVINSEHYDRYSYCFFKDEEIGCIGSNAFTLSAPFKAMEAVTSCFIGVDRQCDPGKPEIAQYGCDSDELDAVLTEQLPEFELTYGSYTDCSTLSEESTDHIPCFNITAGYRDEHTSRETIHVPSMEYSAEALKKLRIPDVQYEYDDRYSFSGRFGMHDYNSRTYWMGGKHGGTTSNPARIRDWDNYDDGFTTPGTAVKKDTMIIDAHVEVCCDRCDAHLPLYENVNEGLYVCEDCLIAMSYVN